MKRLWGSLVLSLLISQNIWGQSIHASRDCILNIKMKKEGNVSMISSSNAAKLFDVQMSRNNNEVKLYDLGNELTFSAGSKEAVFNGEIVVLISPPIKEKEELLIPFETTAQLFCYQIVSLDGQLVLSRTLNEEEQECLGELEDIVNLQKEYLYQIPYDVAEYNKLKSDYKEQAEVIWKEIKDVYKNQAVEEEADINRIKANQKTYASPAKLFSNNVIGALKLQKGFFSDFSSNEEENKVRYKQIEEAYAMLDIQARKLTSDYYGFETKQTIYDIAITFNTARDNIYLNRIAATDKDKEAQLLMLQAKKMRLNFIKEELKEKGVIDLVNLCTTCIDDKIEILKMAEAQDAPNKQVLDEIQRKLDKEVVLLDETFFQRANEMNVTVIDDSKLSDDALGATTIDLISNKDSEAIFAFKDKLYEAARQLDVLGARKVMSKDCDNDYQQFEKIIKRLNSDYVLCKKGLKSPNCKSYLERIDNLMKDMQIIYSHIHEKKMTNKQLLKELNQMETATRKLYLEGQYTYSE